LLLAYGQGLGGSVLHAFLNMGNDVIVLWPGQTSMQAGGQRAGKKVSYEYEDVEAIRDEVPLVRAVSAETDRDFGFKLGTRVVSIQVRGVEMPYGQMRKLILADGRYFQDGDFSDHRRVVILGYEATKKVFQAHRRWVSMSASGDWILKSLERCATKFRTRCTTARTTAMGSSRSA
jgi:putative ABC transport system permease protein